VVALATEWSIGAWEATLRDCEHDASKLSTWLVARRSSMIVTPRIFIDLILMMSGGGRWSRLVPFGDGHFPGFTCIEAPITQISRDKYMV